MWGIRLADSVHLHDMGFIPAHAGNTVPYGHVPGLCQVHPRSRGEYDGVITSIGLNLLAHETYTNARKRRLRRLRKARMERRCQRKIAREKACAEQLADIIRQAESL